MRAEQQAARVRRLSTAQPDFDAQLQRLLDTETDQGRDVEATVRGILSDVCARGDAALVEYTNRFDRRQVKTAGELELRDYRGLSRDLPARDIDALRLAAGRIRAFHERQLQLSWRYEEADGTVLGQQVTPLERVGVYVPGGKAAYPSSVLMNVIPAKVAGVGEIVMMVPAPGGEVSPLVLAAADVAGVDRLFTVGGAQAIGALAYGTATVPAVDKIVGPGNAYVAAAKAMVFGRVGIDLLAGPSEIVVFCDSGIDPEWVALDLFSQAEHEERALAVLLCADRGFLDQVAACIVRRLPEMERASIIGQALTARGALIEVRDAEDALVIINRIAPEHLELCTHDAEALLPRVRHAGAIFVGGSSPVALGDYCAGPNHVLPTARTARFSSPLGVYDFQKRSSVIKCSEMGARVLAPVAAGLARGEGFFAHALSAEARAAVVDNAGTRLERWLRPDVRALHMYHVPESAASLIKLDAMENPYGWPEDLQRRLAERLKAVAVNRYPEPRAARLRELMGAYLPVPPGWDFLFGNGSDELIQLLCIALAGPDRSVLMPAPTFEMYGLTPRYLGFRVVQTPLQAESFALDRPALLAAIKEHNPALIFLASPNNPTGMVIDAGTVRDIALEAQGMVVLDEAYCRFAGGSILPALADLPNLFVLHTLSKIGMAGLRVGTLLAPAPWIAELDKIRLPYNVNSLSQAAAEFAFEHADVIDRQTRAICAERERLYGALSTIEGVRVWPSRANFLLVRIAGRGEAAFRHFLANGVLVKNLHGKHPMLRDCLRVTVGLPAEDDAFLHALHTFIER
jgi:histidinol dehydrogenase